MEKSFEAPVGESLSPQGYMESRLPSRTYLSESFILKQGRDAGQSGRFIYKVFDESEGDEGFDETGWDRKVMVVDKKVNGRRQIQLTVAREAGAVREIVIQKANVDGSGKLKQILKLNRAQSEKFIDLVRNLEQIPAEGERRVVDDETMQAMLAAPEALHQVYEESPEVLRELVKSDATANDIIALQRRREVVAKMKLWLEDDVAFDNARETSGGQEAAWQKLLEENPWVLGIGLGGQLFTSWSSEKLEQVVAGHNIQAAGKRADALLETNGAIRSIAFAEIKHHKTHLLKAAASPYRSGTWAMSDEFTGGVVQSQQTVHSAVSGFTSKIDKRDVDGAISGESTYVVQPRSFLIIGSLEELRGANGGVIEDKFSSFELYRRNIVSPEVITFDELVARAEWHVRMAEAQEATQ